MSDNDLKDLHKGGRSSQSSRHTKVISSASHPKTRRKTLADTLKSLFSSGDFIVADDPHYARRLAVRILGSLTLACGVAFVVVFVVEVVHATT